MITPAAEGPLGRYLRNALHSEASAELLKPIADVASTVLGVALREGTPKELDRALDALPPPCPGGEPLERNAGFAAAEFGLSGIELDILLLALRLRRSRSLARFCNAVQDVLRDAVRHSDFARPRSGASAMLHCLRRPLADLWPDRIRSRRILWHRLCVGACDKPGRGRCDVCRAHRS